MIPEMRARMTLPTMLARALAWRPGGLARNTAFTTAWNVWRILLQALSLVALARLFGAEGYGVLAGTIALFVACAQFVGMGTGIALVRDSVRDPGAGVAAYARTRTVYLATGLACFLLAWPLGVWILGDQVPAIALAALGFAELVAAPAVLPLAYRLQSQERMGAFGALLSLPPAIRLAVTLALLLLDQASITGFALLYLGAMLGASLAAQVMVSPRPWLRPRWADLRYLRQGLPYVLPGVTAAIGSELDKTMLLRWAGAAVTGHYAAAHRIMQAAAVPVASLVLAAAPRLFRTAAATGRPHGARLLVLAALGYALLMSVLLWLLAPLAPWLLGAQFLPSVDLLRGLSLVLVATCLRQVTVALLTTSDLQRIRNQIEVWAAAASIGALLVAIPLFSAWGAVAVLGATDLLVVAAGGITLYRHRHMAERA